MAYPTQLAALRHMIGMSGAALHRQEIDPQTGMEQAAEASAGTSILPGPRWFPHHPRLPSVAGSFLAPQGIPAGRSISLASSRLPRSAPANPAIGRAIRTFFRGLTPSDVIVSVAGTTLDDALVDGARRWRHPIMRFLPAPARSDRRRHWLELKRARPGHEFPVFYDPTEFPDRDALLLASCHHVKLLSVRSGGNLERLLTDRQSTQRSRTETPLLLVDQGLTRPATRTRLRAVGVGDWYLVDAGLGSREQGGRAPRVSPSSRYNSPMVPVRQIQQDLLSHWTRPSHALGGHSDLAGPWSRIWETRAGLPGCLDRLHSILVSQVLRGGGKLVRHGRPVCSFTEVPLASFPKHRTFRPHLARWDFELAGIAIARTALRREGGKRVRYLPQAELDRLAPDEQVWCQPADGSIDWSAEREWRVEGDLNLGRFGPDELVVFVPDRESALALREVCRWKIAFFDSTAQSDPAGN